MFWFWCLAYAQRHPTFALNKAVFGTAEFFVAYEAPYLSKFTSAIETLPVVLALPTPPKSAAPHREICDKTKKAAYLQTEHKSTYTIRFQQPGWLPGAGFVEALIADPGVRIYPVLRQGLQPVEAKRLTKLAAPTQTLP